MGNITIVTYVIIGFTALISYLAFNNRDLMVKFKHWPYQEARNGEYYRWLTSGLLHGDPMHLIFNMLTLFFFGSTQYDGPYVAELQEQGEFLGLENWFKFEFGAIGPIFYLLFYALAIVAASSATYYKYRNSPGFASIGASGAVSAVLFAAILIKPTIMLSLFFFVPLPGFIFGIAYLWYSSYAARRGGDNIDHTAHFYGAVFGFCFPLLFKPSLIVHFFTDLVQWFGSFVN